MREVAVLTQEFELNVQPSPRLRCLSGPCRPGCCRPCRGAPRAVDAPLSTGRHGLAEQVTWFCDAYRGLRAEFPEFQPLAVWPEPGGFLPFASSIDGDQLGWLTEGTTPDDWPLIVYPRHAPQGPPLTGTLTDILLEWLRGRFRTEGLPGLSRADDPLEYIGFEPVADAE
jgi:hypothetical protein